MSNANDSTAAETWTTILRLGITEDLDKMAGPPRHPLVCWRTAANAGNEFDFQMKCTEVLFECLGNGVKFRITATGTYQEEDGQASAVVTQELRLTSRVEWATHMTRFHGNTHRTRMIEVDFEYPDGEAGEKDIVRLEIVVPRTTDSDKGKLLKLAFDWAGAAVAAHLLYVKLVSRIREATLP